jgi:hypothetical protein
VSAFDPTGTFYKILPEVYRATWAQALEAKDMTAILGFDVREMDGNEAFGRCVARLAWVQSQAIVHECQRIEREAESPSKAAKRTGRAYSFDMLLGKVPA